ncbi:uncharacterized protein LOC114366349 [Ostrinia furnacalis]|uniref:uncharacterized protein LOC114366349 n=1 Tax=Ostrinia furnacalis TaxID=93504 RepID=UPI00103CC3A0|nr:uncharacterized protein LOC114366349 [Ostrinia furnacalis]
MRSFAFVLLLVAVALSEMQPESRSYAMSGIIPVPCNFNQCMATCRRNGFSGGYCNLLGCQCIR